MNSMRSIFLSSIVNIIIINQIHGLKGIGESCSDNNECSSLNCNESSVCDQGVLVIGEYCSENTYVI
jgi:hypothetical protein